DAAHRVTNGIAHAQWSGLRVSSHVHDARDSLNYLIVRGPHCQRSILSKTRNRAIHQAGIYFCQDWIIETQPGHYTGPEIFDHDVRNRREFLENLFAFGRFEVDGDGLLACVDGYERDAHQLRIPFRIGAKAAGEISVFRMLDLDDLGSQQDELKAAERPCQDVGYIQHADTMEWKRHLSFF